MDVFNIHKPNLRDDVDDVKQTATNWNVLAPEFVPNFPSLPSRKPQERKEPQQTKWPKKEEEPVQETEEQHDCIDELTGMVQEMTFTGPQETYPFKSEEEEAEALKLKTQHEEYITTINDFCKTVPMTDLRNGCSQYLDEEFRSSGPNSSYRSVIAVASQIMKRTEKLIPYIMQLQSKRNDPLFLFIEHREIYEHLKKVKYEETVGSYANLNPENEEPFLIGLHYLKDRIHELDETCEWMEHLHRYDMIRAANLYEFTLQGWKLAFYNLCHPCSPISMNAFSIWKYLLVNVFPFNIVE